VPDETETTTPDDAEEAAGRFGSRKHLPPWRSYPSKIR